MMNYTDVKSPVWGNAGNTVVNCQVLFDGYSEYLPFTASPADSESHSVEIFNECVAGKWGAIAAYTPSTRPVPTANDNKLMASQLLAETDWTTIPDVSDPAVSNPYLTNKAAFSAYRGAVRAIAINPTAGNLTWPVKPSAVWS